MAMSMPVPHPGLRARWIATVLAPVLALLLALTLSAPARALTFSKLVVFGDSNVDNGNLFALSGGAFNGPPNFQGRNSNGILVVEYAAATLGLTLEDYAVSGARSGLLNAIQIGNPAIDNSGALSQINNWQANVLGGGPADPNALYVYWAGSNDLIGATPATLQSRIDLVRSNITSAMNQLDALGARWILVATRTPRQFLDTQNDQFGQALNADIRSFVPQLDAGLAATIQVFDSYEIVADMMRNPALYGFTQPNALCIDDPVCRADTAFARGFVAWDAAHKTTRVHELMAERLVLQAAAIPEPAVLWLMLPGALCVVAVARRRGQRANS